MVFLFWNFWNTEDHMTIFGIKFKIFKVNIIYLSLKLMQVIKQLKIQQHTRDFLNLTELERPSVRCISFG